MECKAMNGRVNMKKRSRSEDNKRINKRAKVAAAGGISKSITKSVNMDERLIITNVAIGMPGEEQSTFTLPRDTYKSEIINSYLRYEQLSSLNHNYMIDVQTDIKPRMRTILYSWMIDVHQKFKLKEVSLWTAFSICDRYLSQNNVHRRSLQLVGSCCLWIACKYQEIYPPLAADFVYISDNTFSREALFKCEMEICQTMDYDFTTPTGYSYASRFIEEGIKLVTTHRHKERIKWLTQYALERAVLHYELLQCKPSELAAGALYCSMALTGYKWSDHLTKVTSHDSSHLKPVARALRRILMDFENRAHSAVIQKYSSKSRGAVALLRKKTSSTEQAKALCRARHTSRTSSLAN